METKESIISKAKRAGRTVVQNDKIQDFYVIQPDDYPDSPRGWCNLGTMHTTKSRYFDFSGNGDVSYTNAEDIPKPDGVWLPVCAYVHSGVSVSTRPYGCAWDSGQIGYISVSREKLFKEYGWKRLTKKRTEQIQKYLRGEIETLDQYLTGDVYQLVRYEPSGWAKSGEILFDSTDYIGGYYGLASAEEEAEAELSYYVKRELEESRKRRAELETKAEQSQDCLDLV